MTAQDHDLPTRVTNLETDLRDIERRVHRQERERSDTARWLRNATVALVVAMLGAVCTAGLAAGSAAVAYGELREQSQGTERQIEQLRIEVRDVRAELRAIRGE